MSRGHETCWDETGGCISCGCLHERPCNWHRPHPFSEPAAPDEEQLEADLATIDEALALTRAKLQEFKYWGDGSPIAVSLAQLIWYRRELTPRKDWR